MFQSSPAMKSYFSSAICVLLLLGGSSSLRAADWPMFGRDATRNAVSPEKNPPMFWQLEDAPIKWKENRVVQRAKKGVNIQWTAPLGTMCLSAPVVSDGLVWVGTNHVTRSQEKKVELKQGAVLQCRRATDGKLLYEYVSPKLNERYQDASFWQGLACSPLVIGDRLWFVSNRCEVMCFDISPLTKTHEKVDELRVVWKVDMREKFGVYPRVMYMGPGRLYSIGPPYRGHIYVTTGNGSHMFQRNVVAPKAPSLVCLNQATGELRWTDNTPGKNILQGSFGSPLVVEISGRGQVIAPQGDGWLRSFDALSGELIWEFDINPKTAKYGHLIGRGSRNWFMSTPVLYKSRVFMASGQGAEQGEGPGRLCCIDPTKKGDISSELAVDAHGKLLPRRRTLAVDTKKGEKALTNPNSGLVWEFTKAGDEFEDTMHRTVCTVAIHDDLVIAPDTAGGIHCLDAMTGKRYWSYDALSDIWASPLIVDGRAFVGDQDGYMRIFKMSKTKHDPIEVNMNGSVYASPVYANGVLYVAGKDKLVAIRERKSK